MQVMRLCKVMQRAQQPRSLAGKFSCTHHSMHLVAFVKQGCDVADGVVAACEVLHVQTTL